MFSHKNLKKTNHNSDIDADLITVNNFFAYFVKEVSVTKYVVIRNLYHIFPL